MTLLRTQGVLQLHPVMSVILEAVILTDAPALACTPNRLCFSNRDSRILGAIPITIRLAPIRLIRGSASDGE